MFTVFLRTIKDRRRSLIIYCLSAILFIWMYVALFPTLEGSLEALKSYIESFPEGVLSVFGIDAEIFTTFEGYIGSEQYTFVWPIMMMLLMISFSSWMIAGEIERGSIEILLSQPISRVKIFFARYLAGVFNLLIFVIASIAPLFPMVALYDISIKSENFIKLGILGFLLGLAIFGTSTLFSVILNERGKANFIPAGILIFMYVLNIIAGLKESLENLRYLSFFYYFNPNKILVFGEIDKYSWWVFIGTFVITTILSAIWFQKRDIAV